MGSAIIADGYLLKKKKDDRRNFLASKYQRRYFELTADTLAYAKDPRELKDGGGNIEVFAIHELKYIKKLEDSKLEMKFPERVLRVKAESKKEHERWYEAVKDARQKKVDGNNTPQAKQLESLKEHTKQQILTALEEDSDDDTAAPSRAQPGPGTQPTLADKDGLQPLRKKDPFSIAPSVQPQSTAAIPSNRPPSPRSLLANPRMGTRMISTPSHKETEPLPEDDPPMEPHPKARSRWQDEEDEDAAEAAAAGRPHTVSGAAKGAPTAHGPSERLQLGIGAPKPRTASGGTAPPTRGEKLQLGDSGKPPKPSPAVAAAPRPVKDAERISLGNPEPTTSAGVTRGRPSSAASGATDPALTTTDGDREEWQDDDWDSSDDDDGGVAVRGGGVGRDSGVQQRQQPSQVSVSTARSGSAHGTTRASMEGRRSDEGPNAKGVSVGAPLPVARAGTARTATPPSATAKAGSGAPARQRREIEEGEDPEDALAKHAAGTDHLEDNWDSDDEEQEIQPPQAKQAGRQPVAPLPKAPTPPPARRIPGPPQAPAAPAPRPQPSPRLQTEPAVPPSRSGVANGQVGASAASTGAGRQQLELGSTEQMAFKSNVVHDPNAKPDNSNWLEENWDDDDD